MFDYQLIMMVIFIGFLIITRMAMETFIEAEVLVIKTMLWDIVN